VNIIHQARLQRLGIQAERFQSPLKDLFAIPGISLILHIYSGQIIFCWKFYFDNWRSIL